MALNRSTRYPGRFNTATTAHPQGAFKNRTSPTSQDGSYLEADWANDWDGFFGSLLSAAGLTPDGNVDAVGASQYYNALSGVFAKLVSPTFTGVPISTTPAQFDNSTKIATTAFIQRALGNYSDVMQLSVNTTLPDTAFGKYIETVVAGLTITLPSVTSHAGGVIEFYNNTTSPMTISAGTTVILGSNNPTGTTSMTVGAGVNIKFVSTGVQWRAISGANSVNLGTSGYQRYPSGLIEVWGITSPSSSSAHITTTFPQSFTTACYSLTLTPIIASAGAFTTIGASPTISSFTSSVWTATGTRAASISSFYRAIGV